jgi:hypothetical protein
LTPSIFSLAFLIPNLQETIPRTSANGHSIFCYAKAAYSVIVASKNSCTFGSNAIPDVAIEIVIAGQ